MRFLIGAAYNKILQTTDSKRYGDSSLRSEWQYRFLYGGGKGGASIVLQDILIIILRSAALPSPSDKKIPVIPIPRKRERNLRHFWPFVFSNYGKKSLISIEMRNKAPLPGEGNLPNSLYQKWRDTYIYNK